MESCDAVTKQQGRKKKDLLLKLSRASFGKKGKGKAHLHSTDFHFSPHPVESNLKKTPSLFSPLMSPVYVESSFRGTFLNVQLSLMLLCRLLNKAPAANSVGA